MPTLSDYYFKCTKAIDKSIRYLGGRFKTSERRSIDRAMMIVATIHPLAAIPQVVEIYANQSAVNVSLGTWLSFMLIGVIFFLYALIHDIKPMIANQVLWFLVDAAIVAGIFLYG